MAVLCGHADAVKNGGPGFLTPIFRDFPTANAIQIQVVDRRGKVERFEPIDCEGELLPASRTVLQEGDAALWAFRDWGGAIHCLDWTALRAAARGFLADSMWMKHPLEALELAEFCRLLDAFPEVALVGYRSLEAEGQGVADVWRDTQVFAPAIRRDLLRSGKEADQRLVSRGLVVLTRRKTLLVYAAGAPTDTELPETRDLLRVFRLNDVSFRRRQDRASQTFLDDEPITVVGAGPVARRVFRELKAPGNLMRWSQDASADGFIAFPPPTGPLPPITSDPDQLFIAVTEQRASQVDVARELVTAAPRRALKHHILVRRNLRVEGWRRPWTPEFDLYDRRVPHFSVVWIVANHRNRFTTATPNALAASSHAARTVRSLVRSIIDSHGRGPHLRWLRGGRKGRSLALVGVSRPRKTDTLEMVARGAVYSLLTQEIVAATAELIVVHVPGLPEQEPIEVSGCLGPFEYRVHLVGRRRTSRSNEVIAWALGVHPGPEEPDFADFCAGLLAGYGDVQRNGRALGLEVDYGRILLTVLAIGDPEELSALIDVAESSMGSPALVMTNRLIDVGFSDFARSRGFEVVHHGALAQYMRSTFELEPLDNEDRSWSIRK